MKEEDYDPYQPLKDLTEEQRKETYDYALNLSVKTNAMQRSEDILHGREERKTKVCSKCKEVKGVEEFGVDKSMKAGISSACKQCKNLAVMKSKKNNKEKNLISLSNEPLGTKKCGCCKKERRYCFFGRDVVTYDGYRSQCKKCLNKKKVKIENKTVNKRYKKYERNTIARNMIPLLFEQFEELTSKPCSYCGGWSNKELKFTGIDRINNSRGYEIDNCSPCCKFCNFLKRDFSRREFIRFCNKIANFTKGKGYDGKSKVEDPDGSTDSKQSLTDSKQLKMFEG